MTPRGPIREMMYARSLVLLVVLVDPAAAQISCLPGDARTRPAGVDMVAKWHFRMPNESNLVAFLKAFVSGMVVF